MRTGDGDGEERRRAIEMVLERRPDMDFEELLDILGELGIETDEPTLVADLNALGYDVDEADTAEDAQDPADVAMVAGATAGGREAAPSGAVRPDPAPSATGPSALGGTDAFADGPEPVAAQGRGFARSANPTVVVAVAVVVVALLIAGFLALSGGDDDETAAEEGDDPTAEAPPTTAAVPQRVAPAGPGSDPALAGDELRGDDFEREGPGLGDFPGVGPWEALGGEWQLAEGRVSLTGPSQEVGNVVVFDSANADVRAQVLLVSPTNTSGLAFRVQDEGDFYLWGTAPEFGSIALSHVVDGVSEVLVDSGLADSGGGMPTLGIHIVGSTVELLHEGVVAGTYDDLPPAEGRTRIGLGMAAGDGNPVFDDVAFKPGA
ncbi:hypothetical protein [Iamia sp.]|uniref:hypothetical protein n=1 Tax=Iamia sp. TaxID=2722710 RepID=UPI002BAACEBB|nr:hypothetical protein [Iamia sp.]HXH56156.1 hypothetical protein [Iamia sp.]